MLNVFITEGGKNQLEILVLICHFQKEFNFLQPKKLLQKYSSVDFTKFFRFIFIINYVRLLTSKNSNLFPSLNLLSVIQKLINNI